MDYSSVYLQKGSNMKYKEFYFDIEMIIDHSVQVIMNQKVTISTHRKFRGMKLKELLDLIRSNNNVPQEENVKITFMIRGVNY